MGRERIEHLLDFNGFVETRFNPLCLFRSLKGVMDGVVVVVEEQWWLWVVLQVVV